VTKGGLRRPDGHWVPDGRAKHLAAACDASRRALDVDAIDLYLLHAVDPRTPLATSVRALAALQRAGMVRRVGLSNVNVGQIEAARAIVDVAAVEVSLSVLDDDSIRNGVVAYCRDHGIRIIAHRPLGGHQRAARLTRDPALIEVAARHDATPYEIALAWLRDLDPLVVPIPGATRMETARSLARVLAITLTDDDRAILDARFPVGRLLQIHTAARTPADPAAGEVVIVMGTPAAGKSSVARDMIAHGYERLNRDERGGTVANLLPTLDAALAEGRTRWVLDNTYPSRKARNEVIECAWRHDVPVRCIWLDTAPADAQVNAVTRMIAAHGRLPMPEEIRARGRTDHRFFGPDAQFRYARALEPPVEAEGFTRIERRTFERRLDTAHTARALILEYDGGLCESASGSPAALSADDVAVPAGLAEALGRYHSEGWKLLGIAWRPQLAAATTTHADVQACFDRTRALLGIDFEIACCPHPAGPPICWCRKPLPGLVLDFALRNHVALDRSVVIGRSAADATLARTLSASIRSPPVSSV
jgi:diketogulonate reductase-like aldo/keto reductase/histidinol phosphatase-like enzyme